LVAFLVAKMLIPVYLRGSSYYLHARIKGVQFKKSLQTKSKALAMIRACKWLEALVEIDLSNIRRYEIDLHKGVLKSDGEDDHRRLMEALALLKGQVSVPPAASKEEPSASRSGLTLMELLDKFFLLKKLKPATVTALKNTSKEFSSFQSGKCYITDIMVSDITRYQEHLAKRGNVPRTIDGKVGHIKTLLNFALKQKYLIGSNPAEGMNLLTKKQRLSDGYATFELPEIQKVFSSDYFKEQKESDPDYYWTLLLGVVSGCRISEITSLQVDQFQITDEKSNFIQIRDAKTLAGKREVPLPEFVFQHGLDKFLDDKKDSVFKYASREGKGSGNAVGKKFARHLELLNIKRDKLVFHSIRKFVNDFYMKNGIEFEPRCQVIGHEIESVNVATYSKKYGPDELAKLINPVQTKILMLTKILQTEF
jgi:site-specific recombinase XerD